MLFDNLFFDASPPRLFLEIDIGQLLASAVAHDEASVVEFFNRPGRREAAGATQGRSPTRKSQRSATTIAIAMMAGRSLCGASCSIIAANYGSRADGRSWLMV